MADKKITDLALKATAGATDIVPIVDPSDNVTKRSTVAGLATALLASFTAKITNSMLDTTTGQPGGAWQSFTPVWSASTTAPAIGNGVLTGAYMQVGKTVHYRLYFKAGSTTTFGAGSWRFSLPVPALSAQAMSPNSPGVSPASFIGGWYAENPLVVGYGGTLMLLDTTKVVLHFSNTTAGVVSQVSASAPGTWANTWYIMGNGTYEAA